MNFTFFESYFDAIRELEPVDRLAVYDAICEYGVTGNVPELTGVAAMAFKLIRPNIDKSHSRSAAGAVGAASRWQTDSKPMANGCDADSKPMQEKDKEKEKEKEKDKKRERFAPPSPEDVRAYCEEKGYKVDADAFVDFYAAKGWKVGNQPMKDWKAAVRTWTRRESSAPPGKVRQYRNRYNDFPQRNNDYDQIQEDWIRASFGK